MPKEKFQADASQQILSCPKSTTESLEKAATYVQS